MPRRARGRRVCEVYPHPAHVSLFDLEQTLKYKARGRRSIAQRIPEYQRYLHHLRQLCGATPALQDPQALALSVEPSTLRGKALKALEDSLDAVTCAYVASYLWYHGPAAGRCYGTVEAGHILTPLPAAMAKRLT